MSALLKEDQLPDHDWQGLTSLLRTLDPEMDIFKAFDHPDTETVVKAHGGVVRIVLLSTGDRLQVSEAAADILIGQLQMSLNRARVSRIALEDNQQ